MKCTECNQTVANWPAWLNNTKVSVRCAKCIGAGQNAINAPTERTILTPLTEMANRYDLAEAA